LIEGLEVASGVWVLQHRETERNMGVVLGEGKDSKGEGVAVETTLVDPGHLEVERQALQSFVAEMGGTVKCLLFTSEPEYSDMVEWSQAQFITPTTRGEEQSVTGLASGWEVQTLSQGSYIGLYGRKERVLFCGDMLRKGVIPTLRHGTQNYLDALDAIDGMEVRLALPTWGSEARGKREIKARIEHDRSYAMSVLRHVLTSRAAHVPLERVLEVAAQIYEEYPDLELHLRNIRYAWQEMGGT
jgi:hypothetical protein